MPPPFRSSTAGGRPRARLLSCGKKEKEERKKIKNRNMKESVSIHNALSSNCVFRKRRNIRRVCYGFFSIPSRGFQIWTRNRSRNAPGPACGEWWSLARQLQGPACRWPNGASLWFFAYCVDQLRVDRYALKRCKPL